MKKVLLGVMLVFGLVFIGKSSELHVKEINAVPGDVEMIQSSDMGKYAKAVLLEDPTHNMFGVAIVEKKFGFLYRYDGGSWGNTVGEGEPFQATGYGNSDDFVVAIKTAANSGIDYIALGNHMEGGMPTDQYELTLDDVRENMDEYHLQEVKDHYVLFVTGEYSEDTWTIRAFDQDGNLIADKLYGGAARYIDENEGDTSN